VLPGRGVPDEQARLDRFAAVALALAGGVALAVLGGTAGERRRSELGCPLPGRHRTARARGPGRRPRAAAGGAVAALTLAGALVL
jgi:hypothetical protein